MPVRVRKPAPFFRGQAVEDGKVKEIRLTDYQNRYLVLLFYPMDFTYVSPTEILGFSERATEFCHYNCSIIGVSTDSEFTHLAWMKLSKEEGGLGGVVNIALLSDKSMKIARDYGVLDRDAGISHRGLFIIDNKSMIRHITMNDVEVGRSVGETLRLVKAFQFTDRYIKVCPVDWRPGDRGLRPDPTQPGRYFEGYFNASDRQSSGRIKQENTAGAGGSTREQKTARDRDKALRIVVSHSAPSNIIQNSSSVENVGEVYYSSPPVLRIEKFINAKEFKRSTVKRSGHPTSSFSLQHIKDTKGMDLKDKIKYYHEMNRRVETSKKEYTLYSATVPSRRALKAQQKDLQENMPTTSKSDTTQRYNNQRLSAKERQISKASAQSKKDSQVASSYYQNVPLKCYMQGHYNQDEDLSACINKNVYVWDYNGQDVNEAVPSKPRHNYSQERRDSSNSNKANIVYKTMAKEMENVKDMTYHPLNDVLKVKPIQVNNNLNMDTRGSSRNEQQYSYKQISQKYLRNYQDDQIDQVKRYLACNNYRYQENDADVSRQRNFVRGPSDVPVPRRDHSNRSYPTNPNEHSGNYERVWKQNVTGQVGPVQHTGRPLKSSLKKTARQVPIMEEGRHWDPQGGSNQM